MSVPQIFDRRLRRLRRDRAAGRDDFLRAHMAEELLARLGEVRRDFTRVLELGAKDDTIGAALRAQGMNWLGADAGFRNAANVGGVQCDEDALPFADASFDLLISAGGLEQINDLPGALLLARRVLRPDGLFLAAFPGAGSLPLLRRAMLAADDAEGRGTAPRIHPQIDVRTGGDLLARAGFALPVADGDALEVRYRDPWRLIRDLRAMAGTNLLHGRGPAFTRRGLRAMLECFAKAADAEGRITERFEIVYLIGWAPAPSQPQPARRGSGTRSLTETLKAPPRAG